MHIVLLVRERSTCIRRKVGALAVRDNRILATGYNGVPSGLKHCSDVGCIREQYNIPSGQRHEFCRGIHAEQNVIIQAATNGLNLTDAELYCTTQPCVQCCKMLINCRIRAIYYLEPYPDELAEMLCAEAEIKLCKLKLQKE